MHSPLTNALRSALTYLCACVLVTTPSSVVFKLSAKSFQQSACENLTEQDQQGELSTLKSGRSLFRKISRNEPAFVFKTNALQSQSTQPQDLISQETLSGTLSSKGETRSYPIHIAANEFVLIRALQKEMDVEMTLLDAADHVLAKMDMEVDTDRAEYLGWVSPRRRTLHRTQLREFTGTPGRS